MLTYSSEVVNGQLVQVMEGAWRASGNAVGPLYRGGAATPATIPRAQSAGANSANAQAAGAAPWDPRVSPLPLLVVMLVLGLVGLRYIHWNRG